MFGITKGKKKIVVVSCSHGHLIDKDAAEYALKFIDNYKPHTVVHLGDFVDMSVFMGNKEDGDDISIDLLYGLQFLSNLRPNLVFLGNHEHRIYKILETAKNETVKFAAKKIADDIASICHGFKAELVPYSTIHDGSSWRLIGNTAFGHGYLYNENAARDHAEMLGRPVVFGHIHRLIRQPARTIGAPEGISVGCLCNIPSMEYAGRRRATVAWDVGFGYGEYNTENCIINLERIKSWSYCKIKKAFL